MAIKSYSTNLDIGNNVHYALAMGFTPLLVMEGILNRLSLPFSEKIMDQDHLGEIIQEESQNLKIDKPVKGGLVDYDYGTSGPRDGFNQVTLGGFAATRMGVRHELFHLHKKHGNYMENLNVISGLKRSDIWKKLRYALVDEPQAILYALLGIKL